MREVTRGGRRYLQFAQLTEAGGLVHAFTTRPLDVGPARDESDVAQRHNRALACGDWGLASDRLTYALQVHRDGLAVVDERPAGAVADVDALITREVGRPLMSFSADCPLLVIHAPAARGLALVHASWRCTVARLPLLAVQRLCELSSCDACELHAGIGPSAGPCCYEVGEDVWGAAEGQLPRAPACFPVRDGRLYFDLWQANADLLTTAGLMPERIEQSGLCTMCRTDLFYSYRREGAGCGRFGLLAALVAE